MTCMAVDSSRFRLERPPVKRVALTINFEAMPRLQGWHLGGFFDSIKDEYPTREETSPKPAYHATGYEFMQPGEGWPIPRTELVGEDRALSIQGDELEVVWTFEASEEGREYPGFDSLMAGLKKVYELLESSVEDHGVSIVPKMVECYYTNEIDGVTASELAVGVLTDWRAPVAARPSLPQRYVGVRLHGCGKPEDHECSSLVMVDSTDDGPPRLAFSVSRDLEEGEPVGESLEQAHEELIALFRDYTSGEMRRKWGES